MEFATLNNGLRMPMEGFGVYQVTNQSECEASVYNAIVAGCSRTREALYAKLGEGKKLTPKAWQIKADELNQTLAKSKPEYGKLVTQLAYAEVITHNKANYERE